MWIKKSEYDRLKLMLDQADRAASEWKAKCRAATEGATTILDNYIVMPLSIWAEMERPIRELRDQLAKLEEENTSLKQKYADEVQKRLALIEQTKG